MARKVLDAEKQMIAIKDVAPGVCVLSEQALAVSTKKDMMTEEELAQDTANALDKSVKEVGE